MINYSYLEAWQVFTSQAYFYFILSRPTFCSSLLLLQRIDYKHIYFMLTLVQKQTIRIQWGNIKLIDHSDSITASRLNSESQVIINVGSDDSSFIIWKIIECVFNLNKSTTFYKLIWILTEILCSCFVNIHNIVFQGSQ